MSSLRHLDTVQRLGLLRQCLHARPMLDNKTMMNIEIRANMASLDHGWPSLSVVVDWVTGRNQYDDDCIYCPLSVRDTTKAHHIAIYFHRQELCRCHTYNLRPCREASGNKHRLCRRRYGVNNGSNVVILEIVWARIWQSELLCYGVARPKW